MDYDVKFAVLRRSRSYYRMALLANRADFGESILVRAWENPRYAPDGAVWTGSTARLDEQFQKTLAEKTESGRGAGYRIDLQEEREGVALAEILNDPRLDWLVTGLAEPRKQRSLLAALIVNEEGKVAGQRDERAIEALKRVYEAIVNHKSWTPPKVETGAEVAAPAAPVALSENFGAWA